MKLSQLPKTTLKETPREAKTASHQLLLRAGMIRQVGAGLFAYLPFFYRTVRKVENIVRSEMDKASACELKLPILQPKELWEESGRWKRYTEIDGIMYHLTGRRENELCLAPTAEEVVVDTARGMINSYKDLPVNFYQIAEKFRDEIRPRFGLMRGSEFTMKDGYSFDIDEEKMSETYEKMRVAYNEIFKKCGLKFKMVQADSGAIGGSGSAEFMVLADEGEDTILSCDTCDYAANVEKATTLLDTPKSEEEMQEMKTIDTPDTKTMDKLEKLTGKPKSQGMKSVLYMVDSWPVAVFIRGDLDVNETKFANLFSGDEFIRPMTEQEIEDLTGAKPGSVGPYKLNEKIKVYFDKTTKNLVNFMVGANATGKHLDNVNWERDVKMPDEFHDLRTVKKGDQCPFCNGKLEEFRGIEVGHIFKLGTKYSEAMKCTYKNEKGEEIPCQMGCYGIGITRLAQSAVEQNHDENGIVWPEEIAPFKVHLVALKNDDPEVKKYADELYAELEKIGIDVLYDDTARMPGEKFAEADLIGCPVRLTVSPRNLAENKIEWKMRNESENQLLDRETVLARLGK